ncbi:MAG: DoxX family membrane protein [Solirubrobacterales bacterium]|jgi:uncharacterized membrane protein YphA (DoxX/SURF4 family)|nr:DoxX family membrane protein [Solirubrobacterales bacterium]
MSTTTSGRDEQPGIPDAAVLGRGLAALRIFVGVIFFANGLSKLFGFRNIEIGPYSTFLINREEARSILEGEAQRSEMPLIPSIVNDFMLPNYGWLQWVLTFVELGVGALLIVGLLSRGAALVGLAQQLFLAALYASSGRWMFEQPHEYVPLVILALVPAGYVWGLDARLRMRRAIDRRWPF